MQLFSYQQINGIACFLCAVYLCLALVLQSYLGLLPCPLCILQRGILALLFLLFLLGTFHAYSLIRARVYSGVTFFIALGGLFLSLRHIWLIHHPSESHGVCVPDLLYLFKQYPVFKALKTLFWGSGDCATMAASFLGLTLPAWTLLSFLSLAMVSFAQIFRKK